MSKITTIGPHTIVQGDCLDTLRLLPENSVPLVVTSPPYDKLRDYKGYKFDFEAIAIELYRVMTPGGVVCWVVGDSVVNGGETLTSSKQKIYFVEVCGFRVHDTMIYFKANFSAPEKVRYHQAFEYIFALSKGAPRVFNPLKDRPNLWAGHGGTFGNSTKRHKDGKQKLINRGTNSERPIAEYGMRMNVWHGKTAGQERPCQPLDHPAQMPEWLAGDLILSWSNEGDLVLDPLAGGGTVAKMAAKYKRISLSMELSEDYCGLIATRLQKSIHDGN